MKESIRNKKNGEKLVKIHKLIKKYFWVKMVDVQKD